MSEYIIKETGYPGAIEQEVVQELVRCRDCKYGAQDEIGRWFCRSFGCQVGDKDGSGFCADGERREDGKQ